jgi:hypothetical protein
MREMIVPLQNPVMTLESLHENFIEKLHFPATIKDAKTGRYITCNEAVAALAGLTPDEYCGQTAYEIQDMLRPGHRSVTDRALTMDHRIIMNISSCVQYKHMWFTSEKSIFIEKVTKIPIIGRDKKVVGILAYGYDITRNAQLSYLFSLYEEYHSSKEAIRYFLHYLQLSHLFIIPPTRRELMVLLSMKKTAAAKYVGKALNISPKTVEENKSRLRDKLRSITLNDLLGRLHRHHEYVTLD